jgi:exosome complex exonuclease DIS3/RRP44
MNYHPEYAPYEETDEVVIYKNQEGIKCSRVIYGDKITINGDGEMTSIRERNMERILCILCLGQNKKYGSNSSGVPYYLCKPLRPEYENLYFYVTSTKRERVNMYVWIEFVEWKRTQKLPIGTIITYIGNIGNRDIEYDMLRYYHKLQLPKWRLENRKMEEIDEVDYEVFSIDPIGCQDIDDAFHYKELGEGKFEIGVHIASPTKYFTSEEWDYIIQQRISTIYLPNKKYNMLPDMYADNLCSLLENHKRYSMSVIYTYENDICIRKVEFKEAKVLNRRAYNYDEVDEGILSNTLNDDELMSIYNFTHRIMGTAWDNHYDSHKMVEFWMIRTNHEIAKMCLAINHKKTILRRCMESGMGHINMRDENIMDRLMSRKEMKSAEYVYYNEDEDMGHHLLQLDYYTHFTSPIRRGIDFYIHLLMKECIDSEYEIDIDKINSFIKRTRKLQRDMKRMEYIFNDDIENGESVLGILYEITDRYVTMYIPKYDLEEKIWIKNRKGYENTEEYRIDIDIDMNTGERFLYKNDIDSGERVEMRLGDEIRLCIYKYKMEEHFRNKIRISL